MSCVGRSRKFAGLNNGRSASRRRETTGGVCVCQLLAIHQALSWPATRAPQRPLCGRQREYGDRGRTTAHAAQLPANAWRAGEDWARPVVSRRRVAVAAGTGRSIYAGPYGRSAQEAAARRTVDASGRRSTKRAAMSALCGGLVAVPTRCSSNPRTGCRNAAPGQPCRAGILGCRLRSTGNARRQRHADTVADELSRAATGCDVAGGTSVHLFARNPAGVGMGLSQD
jgi:hypothetical protein